MSPAAGKAARMPLQAEAARRSCHALTAWQDASSHGNGLAAGNDRLWLLRRERIVDGGYRADSARQHEAAAVAGRNDRLSQDVQ